MTMNQNNDYFRRRLSSLFLLTGCLRVDLARHLRAPVQKVRDWESGEDIPNVYQFREIAGFFGLPYDWFLDGVDATPNAAELAELLGLSESTVETLGKLSDAAPPDVMDAVDDAIFALAFAVQSVCGGKR